MKDSIEYISIGKGSGMHCLLVPAPTVQDSIRIINIYKSYNLEVIPYLNDQYAYAVWNSHYKEDTVYLFQPGKVPTIVSSNPKDTINMWYLRYREAEIELYDYYALYDNFTNDKRFWRALDKLEKSMQDGN